MEHKSEKRICQDCKKDFVIEQDDFSFYEKMKVDSPKSCPDCRAQLRLSFRNERVFYKRKCDKCGRDVVSMYSPNKPYTIWCYDCWFADDWGGEDYALDYNPDQPFFDQFEKLWRAVPKVSLVYVRSPGSEYTNIAADNKNCYYIIESSNNENSIHSYWIQECRDVADTLFASKCELCYECDDCYSSYKLLYSKGCHDCTTSYFLTDCRGCTDCIGSVNLRNKSNYIFNKPYSKEEYEKVKTELKLNTSGGIKIFKKEYIKFLLSQPRKFAEIIQAVNSTGNYMKNVKNCKNCFHCYDAEDNKYGVHVWRNAKDTMDCNTAGRNANHIYNSINAGIDNSNLIAVALCWTCSFVEYSMYCFNSNHCFGCVGLRKKDYYILNKKYGKEEYEKIVEKIKDEMKDKREYGQFFGQKLSCFGYNETPANEEFPLSEKEALNKGYNWEKSERGTYNKGTVEMDQLSDKIDLVSMDVSKEIFTCQSCEKNYRIINDEFSFYKKLDIPLPKNCPDCRHKARMLTRGPNKLWNRKCMNKNCVNEFKTSYAPDGPEIVYCEKCYLAEIA